VTSRTPELTPTLDLSARLPSLTSLRWWAFLLAFGKHVLVAAGGTCHVPTASVPLACTVLEKGFDHGLVAVTTFFVLSGFVLTWTATNSDTKRRFWQRRFARIYPLFLIGLVTDMVVRAITGAEQASVLVNVLNLFLVHTWYPDGNIAINGYAVSWSLSCDLLFYLCFPYLYKLFKRMSDKALKYVFVGAVIWPFLPAVIVYSIEGAAARQSQFLSSLLFFFPGVRISEFVLGIIAAFLLQRRAWTGLPVAIALPVTLGAYAAFIPIVPDLWSLTPAIGSVMAPLVTLLIVSLANADITGGWSPMRGRVTEFLGTMSYPMYLFHYFLLLNLAAQFSMANSLQIFGFAATILVLTLAVSYPLYRWIEVPMYRFLSPAKPDPKKPAEPSQTPPAEPVAAP
jgi:peptidoglycan/LPS O-acetylase OafA/YrhL